MTEIPDEAAAAFPGGGRRYSAGSSRAPGACRAWDRRVSQFELAGDGMDLDARHRLLRWASQVPAGIPERAPGLREKVRRCRGGRRAPP